MPTECTPTLFEFEAVDRRAVVARFDGGDITSNAGALLLGQVDRGLGLMRRFAACFIDRRDPRFVEHGLETLVGQRIFGLTLGYEDLNDHDELRKDPTFAVLAGKLDAGPAVGLRSIGGQEHAQSPGAYAAAPCRESITRSTATGRGSTRCSSICSSRRMSGHHGRSCSISTTPTSRSTASRKGASSTATTMATCYLPLYVFSGRHLLLARQRCANVAGSAGAVEEMARIVAQIRRSWPRVRIILRADSGFANDPLMAWCEANRVDYVFGLARNVRLEAMLAEPLAEAKRLCLASGKPARVFRDFRYRTRDSWSCERRVIGKAEHTLDGAQSPLRRHLLPSHPHRGARPLRGSLLPRAARPRTASASSSRCSPTARLPPPCRPTSSAYGSRPWPTSWSIPCAASACRHTQFADAAVATIRLKLLKLGAQVRKSVRRIHFAITSGCPNKIEFALAYLFLRRAFSSA